MVPSFSLTAMVPLLVDFVLPLSRVSPVLGYGVLEKGDHGFLLG